MLLVRVLGSVAGGRIHFFFVFGWGKSTAVLKRAMGSFLSGFYLRGRFEITMVTKEKENGLQKMKNKTKKSENH